MKGIRPAFGEHNIGFLNSLPKYFLAFNDIREISAENKFNEILLEVELELDALFKQFSSKCELETMDELPSLGKAPKITADIIDRKIAQIRRKMSDNNITIDKQATLEAIK